jgi:hypothetical protein
VTYGRATTSERESSFTAYLKSDLIRELDRQDALALEDLHPDLRKLLEPAREKLREHFRKRAAEAAVNRVEEWKRQEIYPYQGEPKSLLETTERQVFDVVALNITEYLPEFGQSDVRGQKLSMRLLKQAIEQSPRDVQRIIEDVLGLPREKQQELAELLEKTTLTAIINSSKVVADRLNFIAGLAMLVFNPESKAQLRERTQLHRILAENTWLFGEQFSLSVDDQSLTEVLRKHLSILGREPATLDQVYRLDGSKGIVDLMLSRRIPQPRAEEREHLVIELKRPSQRVDSAVAQQIKDYAFSVADDERFRDTKTRWVFWAISNEVDRSVQRETRQRNRPEGLLYDDGEGRTTVWAKSWGEVIEECRGRLEFFQKHLEYTADQESALAYLRKVHEKYLPPLLKQDRGGAARAG